MEPSGALLRLYKERLAGLSALLNSLPDMVTDDEAVRQLSTMPNLTKYRIDRVMELTSNLLHDEKQLTVIAVLEGLHCSQTEQERLKELLSSEQHLRREVEEQLEQALGRKRRNDFMGSHQFASSGDLLQQQSNQNLTEKLLELKLRNNDLEREVEGLRSQLQQAILAGRPAELDQQKHDLEVDQLKELREYLLGELKKNQMKLSEKQLQCDSLEQRQAVLEQENCTLAASNKRLNAELEHWKQDSGEQLGKSIRMENSKLSSQLEDIQLRHRLEVQSLNDSIARLRNSLDEERDSLQREIRASKEIQHQHYRILEEKNAELRQLQDELDRVRHRDDKLTYEVKLKSEQLQKSQSELEMKRKEINKLSQIFEEERIGYEEALKHYEPSRKVDRRRQYTSKQTYFSPQHRQIAHRTMGRFGGRHANSDFEQVNEEITRLENELNGLRSGLHAAKQRSKQSLDQSLHQLRRGLLTLRRAIEKIVRLTHEEMFKMVRELESKARYLLNEERNEHKLKMDKLKQLCDEQIAQATGKSRTQQSELQAENARLLRDLAEKESRLREMQKESHKTKQIIETSENLEQSYNLLMKQYDDLTRKYQELANRHNANVLQQQKRAPEMRSPSPPLQKSSQHPYAKQRERQWLADRHHLAVDKTADYPLADLNRSHEREKSLNDQSRILNKTRQDILMQDQGRRQTSLHKSRQTEFRNNSDPLLKKKQDFANILNNSRRVQLEHGFNELEEEIEAIIQRRNKRSNKYLK